MMIKRLLAHVRKYRPYRSYRRDICANTVLGCEDTALVGELSL